MFWGLILKPNKRYSQTLVKALHLSQAAFDTSSSSDEPVQVIITSDKSNYILCTLRKNKVEQVALDLNFAEGDEIPFTSQGNGSVHLAGYFVPEDDDFMDQLSDEEVEEDTPTAKASSDLDGSMDEEDDDNEEEEDDSEESDDTDSDEVQEPKLKQRKVEKAKQNGLDNGKNVTKEKLKKEKNKAPEKSVKAEEKTIQGGVKIEDVRVGNGAEAKAGKKVQVYYEGRLKSNNKVFDASKQGPGFKFGLGRGEVIKGWDIGVAGMKVGGKRKITCPPNMAYSSKGSPPVIPPNSTLVFKVELKGVQ